MGRKKRNENYMEMLHKTAEETEKNASPTQTDTKNAADIKQKDAPVQSDTPSSQIKEQAPKEKPAKGRKGASILEIKRILEEKKKKEEEERKEDERYEKEQQEKLKKEQEKIEKKNLEKLKLKNEENKKKKKEALKKLESLKVDRFLVKEKQIKKEEKVEKKEVVVSGNLKSPVCCILGHVDTGKTKLLDKLRSSDVQGGEAGGITQQIGATYFPINSLLSTVSDKNLKTDLPGILIIDTPGHESFSNLRSRGTSLCNLAILVVDILHLLEPQTLESIQLLKNRKTPFIVALNKIDRLYNWKPNEFSSFEETLKKQNKNTIQEFEQRLNETILSFSQIGLNTLLFTKNPDKRKYVSLVPTSAVTGEGIPDLIRMIIELTENFMLKKVSYKNEFECTILEVKNTEGFGVTIDVVLGNGEVHEGDKICVCGFDGPIICTVRGLLVPQPLKELRVKGQYLGCKSVRGSMGVKIVAHDLEKAVAGSRVLMIEGRGDETEVSQGTEKISDSKKGGVKIFMTEEQAKKEVMEDLQNVLSSIHTVETGVHVQASTLGSLEALISFLKDSEIPVSSVSIGDVRRKDIKRSACMHEKAPEYALMLCFDIKVEKEMIEFAEEMGVKIISSNIIYHLLDKFKEHLKAEKEKEKKMFSSAVVFPCKLKILPDCVFNKRSPLVMGVCVEQGILKCGTPLCVLNSEGVVRLGNVTSIECNKKSVESAFKGDKVAIKIELQQNEMPRMYGRHFDENDDVYSVISRRSIDVLKKSFRDEMADEDWALVIELKKKFSII